MTRCVRVWGVAAAQLEDSKDAGILGKDSLNEELQDRQKQASRFITLAAKLIAPTLDSKDWVAGFDWVIETLRQDHDLIASEMMISKALTYLRNKSFEKAIEVCGWVGWGWMMARGCVHGLDGAAATATMPRYLDAGGAPC